MTLDTRRVIVTGAARGLGATIAQALVKEGARVVAIDKRAEEGAATATRLGIDFIACDITNKGAVEASFADAAARLGGLDVLAAVAGVDRPGYAPEEIPLDVWAHIMAVNATGTFLTNQAAWRHLHDQGGAIINFASFAGIRGYGDRAAYAAAKGAVLAWTRSAAQAWGRYDIRVNAVAPQMKTAVAERYLGDLDASERALLEEKWQQQVPLGGRLGDPERDLAPLLVFLAGEGARFITGQVFAVDGGMTMLGS